MALFPSILGRAQTASSAWMLSIVLPARVVAGKPAMLAVLGADGKLLPDIAVDVAGMRVSTDATGRAYFTAPPMGRFLIAKASGFSAATLMDLPTDAPTKGATVAPEVTAIREPFSICGSGFGGTPEAAHVRINGDPALVLAASPVCLSVLAGAHAKPGPATISIASTVEPGQQWTATTTLVALDPGFSEANVVPGQKARITVHVTGSEKRLRVAVENQSPGVLRFPGKDIQEVLTTGGPENTAQLETQTIRSGDFSFTAKLLSPPDESLAITYLEGAGPIAPDAVRKALDQLIKDLGRRHDLDAARRRLDQLISLVMPGDFRTLLLAARQALR
jgi:hypothetical protein